MKKNKNIIIAMVAFLVMGWMFSFSTVFAEEDGIWMNMLIAEPADYAEDGCKAYITKCLTLKKFFSENTNIDFANLDNVENFGLDRRNASLPHKNAVVEMRTGEINVSSAGYYQFYVDKSPSGTDITLNINNYKFRARSTTNWFFCDAPNCGDASNPSTGRVYLEEGWYPFNFTVTMTGSLVETPNLTLGWTKSPWNVSTVTTIPKENYRWSNGSNAEVTIPAMSEPEEKIDFYTAGVGIEEILASGGDPKISLKIPDPGPSNADFSDIGNAYVFWYSRPTTDLTPQITIQNTSIDGSPEETVTCTRITSQGGKPWTECYAKIPSNLIQFDETTREMNLKFKGLVAYDSTTGIGNPTGIGVILPYKKDSLAKATRMYIKFIVASSYQGTHPPITFDLDEDLDKSNLKPFLFFEDGQTKQKAAEATPTYRPNFMSMLTGTGDRPAIDAFLHRTSGSKRIFPKEGAGTFSLSDPSTWYPVFGREGAQFDVISTEGNYLPNEESSYIDSNRKDGIIDSINAEGKDWISFQLYSSNIEEDGVDGVEGSEESGGLSVIGLLGGQKNKKLKICPNASLPKYVGETVDLEAWYWGDYNGSGDYCNETGTALNVSDSVGDITWETSNSGIINSTGNGSYEAVSAGEAEIWAEYTEPVSGDLLRSNELEMEIIQMLTCKYNLCDKTTGYECKEVSIVGDSCLPDPTVNSNCTDTATPEICSGNDWKEVTP